MDKYVGLLSQLPVDVLHIAESFAKDNKSPQIEPSHLMRALLHKSVGLYDFIENTLDNDYFYILDWTEIRLHHAAKSAYPMKEVVFSGEAKSVIREAKSLSERYGQELNVQFLLAALVSPGVGFTADQLRTLPLTPDMVLKNMQGTAAVTTAQTVTLHAVSSAARTDEMYCEVMLEHLPALPIIGCDDKVRSLLDVLARKDKANVIIIGETGVGKTSLIQGLLQRSQQDDAPSFLKGVMPYELDLIALSQGVSYKGEIEDRFKKTLTALAQQQKALLVIENIYRIEEKQSVLNGVLPILKRALQKNEIQMICTTTIDGFTKDIEKDKELMAYLEKMQIDEPSEQMATDIVESKMESYTEFHSVAAEEGIAADLVRLSKRYIPERSLPSSALDLLDRAMASVKIDAEIRNTEAMLTKSYVKDVVAKMTGIPIGNLQSEEREKLGNAEEIIHQRLVGQNHAVKSVLDAIYESRSGLNKKGQPIGSFFFLGPTGTGKTELAKSLANFLFNDETSILRFDMSEYKEEHSVALLYGAPPGYVGYEEGGLLVNQIRQHPYSVVLFDEIEKAHKSVFDLFLQILDEGKLHDRLGRVGDFSNALIIFTSNIGSDYIFKSFEQNHIPSHDQLLDVMQGLFRPEFLARLTEIIPFSPITPEMIDKIFDIHIKNLLKALKEQDVKLEIDETARQYITKVGFNAHYGARPILGIIRKEIRRPLSKLIISGNINSGDIVTMKYNEVAKEIAWEIDNPE